LTVDKVFTFCNNRKGHFYCSRWQRRPTDLPINITWPSYTTV